MRMLCLDASGQLWSAPSRVNIIDNRQQPDESSRRSASLPIRRNRKLKRHAWAGIGRTPHPPTVRLDDRAADRKSHAQAIMLGRVECAEQSVCILRLDTDAGVLDRHQYPIGSLALCAHYEHAVAIAHVRHGLHPVHCEIDDDLLQLDSIAAHRERAPFEFELRSNPMPKRLVPQEHNGLFDDLVPWKCLRASKKSHG